MNARQKTNLLAAAIATAVATGAFAQAPAADPAAPRPKEDAVRLGTITVVGQGDKLGAGQILNEDGVKARSTVTKEATEKDRSTGNPYQALSLLPSINTFNHDATGLFGGGLTMRGFNSDQIGFTINGVPVNDSGNFAVFPQEYVDQENICTQTVQQGAGEFEAPHVGATGGSVGIVICDPEDQKRLRVSQTVGQLNLTRTFARIDSGRFANDKAKVFLSYSHSQADKWKGEGGAKRDHIDAAFRWDITPEARILGSAMYNRAVNNNFYSMRLSELNQFGYNYDFASTFTPGRLTPVNGTAQRETIAGSVTFTPPGSTTPITLTSPVYYKLATNPFENLVASLSGSFKLADSLYLKVQPYLWYGYGTGGVQGRTLSETAFLNTTTGRLGAGRDLNGDGDTLDTIIVSSSNVTKTTRPGVTAELNYQLGEHALKLGVWYERAEHRQTGPAVSVDANGNPSDVWLTNGRITRADGSEYQSRDWKTISPAYQLYIADNWSALNDRLLVSVGLRTPKIERQFTNYASEGPAAPTGATTVGSQTTYAFTKSYSEVLPQGGLRFNVDREQQIFANIGKNFRAPPNFAFAPTNNSIALVGGVPTLVSRVDAETSITTDIGYRYQGKAFTASITAFNIDFKNRQSNAFDPNLLRSVYTNAGDVNNRGFELELGTQPVNGFSAYASFTSQKSKIKDDLAAGRSQVLPTSGKQFTLTPETMAGLSLQYSRGALYARVKAKYTGKQFATLMNDEEPPSYTVTDFDAGYNFGSFNFVRNVQLRFNVSNLLNEKFRNPSSASVTNAKPVATAGGTVAAQNVFYFLGAPRMTSVSLSADF